MGKKLYANQGFWVSEGTVLWTLFVFNIENLGRSVTDPGVAPVSGGTTDPTTA